MISHLNWSIDFVEFNFIKCEKLSAIKQQTERLFNPFESANIAKNKPIFVRLVSPLAIQLIQFIETIIESKFWSFLWIL